MLFATAVASEPARAVFLPPPSPRRPFTSGVDDALVPTLRPAAGDRSDALKQEIERAAAAGRPVVLAAGTYDLRGWGSGWRAPRRPLRLVGEPGTTLRFADEGPRAKIELQDTLFVRGIRFERAALVFDNGAPYLPAVEFDDCGSDGVTTLFQSFAPIDRSGARPDARKVGRVVVRGGTFRGNAAGHSASSGLVKVTSNFDRIELRGLDVGARSCPAVYAGYEFRWRNEEGPWHWPGPGHPSEPADGHGDLHVAACTLRNFDNGDGAMNVVDVRYLNRVDVEDTHVEDVRGGAAAEAIYIKCRDFWARNLTILDGTNAHEKTEGALCLKRGRARLTNVSIDNGARSGVRRGYGVYVQGALVRADGLRIRNANVGIRTVAARVIWPQKTLDEVRRWIAAHNPEWASRAGMPVNRIAGLDDDSTILLFWAAPEMSYRFDAGVWRPGTSFGAAVENFAGGGAAKDVVQFRDFVFVLGENRRMFKHREPQPKTQVRLEFVDCAMRGGAGDRDFAELTDADRLVLASRGRSAGLTDLSPPSPGVDG